MIPSTCGLLAQRRWASTSVMEKLVDRASYNSVGIAFITTFIPRAVCAAIMTLLSSVCSITDLIVYWSSCELKPWALMITLMNAVLSSRLRRKTFRTLVLSLLNFILTWYAFYRSLLSATTSLLSSTKGVVFWLTKGLLTLIELAAIIYSPPLKGEMVFTLNCSLTLPFELFIKILSCSISTLYSDSLPDTLSR